MVLDCDFVLLLLFFIPFSFVKIMGTVSVVSKFYVFCNVWFSKIDLFKQMVKAVFWSLNMLVIDQNCRN